MSDALDFTLANLPFGIARAEGEEPRVATRLGDEVAFVGDIVSDPVFERPALNDFLALGPAAWHETRAAVERHLRTRPPLTPLTAVEVLLPVQVGDFVDFYACLEHATNMGRLFRPDGEALLPNWRRLPVAYHGRAGTIAVSGTPVKRPSGLVQANGDIERRPTAALDFELEVGFVVGCGNDRGEPIDVDDALDHVFGAVLLVDWSARDIQAFEYQPLGPFLGKSFLTTISAWVVPMQSLQAFLTDGPRQEPEPDAHLRGTRPWALDMDLTVELDGETVTRTNLGHLYWTFAQQLAHLTSNGARTRPGDLFASGTVSGSGPGSQGSLIELTEGGGRPLRLADGSERTFLTDGDRVQIRGWCGQGEARVGLGTCTGTVVP